MKRRAEIQSLYCKLINKCNVQPTIHSMCKMPLDLSIFLSYIFIYIKANVCLSVCLYVQD
jgi:hypothetical protein